MFKDIPMFLHETTVVFFSHFKKAFIFTVYFLGFWKGKAQIQASKRLIRQEG